LTLRINFRSELQRLVVCVNLNILIIFVSWWTNLRPSWSSLGIISPQLSNKIKQFNLRNIVALFLSGSNFAFRCAVILSCLFFLAHSDNGRRPEQRNTFTERTGLEMRIFLKRWRKRKEGNAYSMKLFKNWVRLDIAKYSFNNRVCESVKQIAKFCNCMESLSCLVLFFFIVYH